MLKMQSDKIDVEKRRDDELKKAQREELRQQYFDMQRKNIEDFKMQKETTENLLMIKGPMMGMGSNRNPS
jgi:3-isopropylmalate dehydratase small subunit